eukprot:gene14595-16103_t
MEKEENAHYIGIYLCHVILCRSQRCQSHNHGRKAIEQKKQTANVPDSLPNDGESVLNSSNLAREIGSERTDDREGVPAKEPATQDLSPSAPSFAPSTPTAIEGPQRRSRQNQLFLCHRMYLQS